MEYTRNSMASTSSRATMRSWKFWLVVTKRLRLAFFIERRVTSTITHIVGEPIIRSSTMPWTHGSFE